MGENTTVDRQPHNVEAELATIGALLIDPDAILRVREIAKPRDFFVSKHEWLYAAYLTAVDGGNDSPDYVTLCDILERQGRLEGIGGAAFITSLINATPTALNVEHYARIVARTGYLRRAIQAAQKIAQLAYADDETSVDSKQEEIERIVFGLAPQHEGEGLEHIGGTMSAVYDEMNRRDKGEMPPGVKTGFSKFDAMTGGLQKSDVIIVAARPSMGKTSLLLNIVLNAAKKHHKRVAVFSLEMSKTQIVQRLIASETGIDSKRLRWGKLVDHEWPLMVNVSGTLEAAQIYIDDRPNQSASQMRSKLRRLLAKVEIDLIVIDYLQLMQADRRWSKIYEEASQVSHDVKGLAKEFNLPVLIGSQLSRACEQRSDKRPMLSDLRESGAIEQDADIVAFIYRDEYYNPATEQPNIAEILVKKHRSGPTGLFPLYFKKETATFRSIELYEVVL